LENPYQYCTVWLGAISKMRTDASLLKKLSKFNKKEETASDFQNIL
jgi:hypothetical protein